jgi:hypothetical protein
VWGVVTNWNFPGRKSFSQLRNIENKLIVSCNRRHTTKGQGKMRWKHCLKSPLSFVLPNSQFLEVLLWLNFDEIFVKTLCCQMLTRRRPYCSFVFHSAIKSIIISRLGKKRPHSVNTVSKVPQLILMFPITTTPGSIWTSHYSYSLCIM